MEENLMVLLQGRRQREELAAIAAVNEKAERFGLTLTAEEARELTVCRNESLVKYRRVEFGAGILDKLIYVFCDSRYLEQDSYLETMEQLVETFYAFKNETGDHLTDDELLTFMKEQFETVCFGDVEYLRTTCLERFAAAVRAGYRGYRESGGSGEYGWLSEEERWDPELFMTAASELFG